MSVFDRIDKKLGTQKTDNKKTQTNSNRVSNTSSSPLDRIDQILQTTPTAPTKPVQTTSPSTPTQQKPATPAKTVDTTKLPSKPKDNRPAIRQAGGGIQLQFLLELKESTKKKLDKNEPFTTVADALTDKSLDNVGTQVLKDSKGNKVVFEPTKKTDKKLTKEEQYQKELYDYYKEWWNRTPKKERDRIFKEFENLRKKRAEEDIYGIGPNAKTGAKVVGEFIEGMGSKATAGLGDVIKDKFVSGEKGTDNTLKMQARAQQGMLSPYNLGGVAGSIVPIGLSMKPISAGLRTALPRVFKETAEESVKKTTAKRIGTELTADTLAGTAYGITEEVVDAAFDNRKDGSQTVGERVKKVAMDAALGLGIGLGVEGVMLKSTIKDVRRMKDVAKRDAELDKIIDTPVETGAIRDDLLTLTKTIERLERRLEDVDSSPDTWELKPQARSNVEQALTQYRAQLDELNKAKDEINKRYRARIEKDGLPKDEMDRLKKILSFQRTQLDDINKQIDSKKADIETARAKGEESTRIDELVEQQKNLVSSKELLEFRIEDLQKRIDNPAEYASPVIRDVDDVDLSVIRDELDLERTEADRTRVERDERIQADAERQATRQQRLNLSNEILRLVKEVRDNPAKATENTPIIENLRGQLSELRKFGRNTEMLDEGLAQNVEFDTRQSLAERMASVMNRGIDQEQLNAERVRLAEQERLAEEARLAEEQARAELPYDDVPTDRVGRIEYLIEKVNEYIEGIKAKSADVIRQADEMTQQIKVEIDNTKNDMNDYLDDNADRAIAEYDSWLKLVQTVNGLTREGGGIKLSRKQSAPRSVKKGSVPIESVAQRLNMTVDELLTAINQFKTITGINDKNIKTARRKKRNLGILKLKTEQAYLDMQQKVDDLQIRLQAIQDIAPIKHRFIDEGDYGFALDGEFVESPWFMAPTRSMFASEFLMQKWFPEQADNLDLFIKNEIEPRMKQMDELLVELDEIEKMARETAKYLAGERDFINKEMMNLFEAYKFFAGGRKIYLYDPTQVRRKVGGSRKHAMRYADVPSHLRGLVVLYPPKYADITKYVHYDDLTNEIEEAYNKGMINDANFDAENPHNNFEVIFSGEYAGKKGEGTRETDYRDALEQIKRERNFDNRIDKLEKEIDNAYREMEQIFSAENLAVRRYETIMDTPDETIVDMVRDVKREPVNVNDYVDEYLNELYPDRMIMDIEPIRLDAEGKPIETPVAPTAPTVPTASGADGGLPTATPTATPTPTEALPTATVEPTPTAEMPVRTPETVPTSVPRTEPIEEPTIVEGTPETPVTEPTATTPEVSETTPTVVDEAQLEANRQAFAQAYDDYIKSLSNGDTLSAREMDYLMAPKAKNEAERQSQIQKHIEKFGVPKELEELAVRAGYATDTAPTESAPTPTPKPVATAPDDAPINSPAFGETIREEPIPTMVDDELLDEMPVAMPREEGTGGMDMPVNEERVERGFNETVRTSANTPDNLRTDVQVQTNVNETASIVDNPNWYEVQPNMVLMNRANEYLSNFKDYKSASDYIKGRKILTDRDIAMAQILIKHYVNTDQLDEALSLVNKISKGGTELGRAVQAFSLWNRLDADGVLLLAERAIENRNRRVADSTVSTDKPIRTDAERREAVEPLLEIVKDIPKVEELKSLSIEVETILKTKINDKTPLTPEETATLKRFEELVNEMKGEIPKKKTDAEIIEEVSAVEPKERSRDRFVQYFDALAREAQRRIDKSRNKLNAMPWREWRDLTIIGASYIAKGVVKFADFTESMLKRYSDDVESRMVRYREWEKFKNDVLTIVDGRGVKTDKGQRLPSDVRKRTTDKKDEKPIPIAELAKFFDLSVDDFLNRINEYNKPLGASAPIDGRMMELYKASMKRFRKERGLPSSTGLERLVSKAIKDGRLTDEEAETFTRMAMEAAYYSDEMRIELIGDLQLALRNLEGVSFWRKVATAQTIAQLLNPKTLIRNALGNEIFYWAEKFSKLQSVPIDMVMSKMTGREREVFFFTGNQESYWKNWFIGAKAGWKGYNPDGIATQFDLDMQVFQSKYNPLYWLEKALGVTLRSFDYAGYKRAYGEAAASWAQGIARAEGLTGPAMKARMQELIQNMGEEMDNVFDQYGKYMTFQDDTILSQSFVGVKRALNLGQDFGLGDLVLKYPRTPANLLMRAIDFSPVGIWRGFGELIAAAIRAKRAGTKWNSAVNKKFVTEAIGRGIVGTMGMTAVGWHLLNVGILTGSADKDMDMKQLNKAAGIMPYSVNISALQRYVFSGFNSNEAKRQKDDLMMNYDWAQPVAVSIAIGSKLGEVDDDWGKADLSVLGEIATNAWETFDAGISTLFEQPLVQGVTRLFTTYPNQTFTDKLLETVQGLPSSFVPTALNQIRTLDDNTKRLTFDKESKLAPFGNKVLDRLPFASDNLPADYNALGEPIEKYQDGTNTPFNVFLNPAFMTRYNPNPDAQMILDLIEETDDKNPAPRVPDKSIQVGRGNDRRTEKLSAEEFSQLSKIVGTKQKELLEEYRDILSDNTLTSEQKLRRYKRILDRANDKARREFKEQNKNNPKFQANP